MAEHSDANKDTQKKKSGIGKKFALAVGALTLAGGAVIGGAIAVNGIDRQHAEGLDAKGQPASLQVTTIKPIFEKQTFVTSDARYWCVTGVSVPCPIPVDDQEKPAYNALRQNLKK